MKRKACYARLHPVSFGVALGIVWGLSMLITGLVAAMTGYGEGFVETMRTIYIGYAATISGSLIGGVWGFVDLFIGGVIVATIYNFSFFILCRNPCVHPVQLHKIKTKEAKEKSK